MLRYVVFLTCLLVASSKSPEEGEAFEGDMILTADQIAAIEEQVSKQNAFAAVRTGLWKTNGKADVIKYYIDSSVSGATNVIKNAIKEYEENTCLRFQQVTTKPSGPHFDFYKGRGCNSYVGRRSYGNRISLGSGCWRLGTVIHEIGHAIGLYHEQSRPDRDEYVTIKLENIQDKYKFAFNKYSHQKIDSRGTPYDYDSIMHYGSKYFSMNGQITIETKNPKDQGRIGQRRGFSPTDIIQINKMYCEDEGGVDCVDKDNNCRYWKSYCDTNTYVKQNCLKSCGRC